MTFKDKVVIITGASSGIGWELAKQLGEQGAKLGLVARRIEKLEQLTSDITGKGGTAVFAGADVSQRRETVHAIHSLREQLGPVDLLIAGAGVGYGNKTNQSNIDEVEKVFQINLLGVVYAIEAVLPEMLQLKRGHISAISSLGSYKGFPGKAAYCASKAAVNTYLEGLRLSLRRRGVKVTTLCPGFVKTPMTDSAEFNMPWVIESDEAARRIIRGLEKQVKVLNFPWQTTLLVKFCTWLPDWLLMSRMKGQYGDTASKRKPGKTDASDSWFASEKEAAKSE